MILKGSQRSGARPLAEHLLNDRDNDHVSVIGMRGFVADDLTGALLEAQAIAKGTQCKQYLFSLSLNPPKEAFASEADFERAADQAEERLGLTGQPRAIIVHEKEGRRHAHVVWSRIDGEKMRAVNLAHFKNKLTALSRELYLEHGWQLPSGLRPDGARNPLNFTLEEWQRAKRQGVDPKEIKEVFRDAWNRADSQRAFAHALAEYGYFLAKGDRRGFVAIDLQGEVYSVARWASVTTKDIKVKLGSPDDLPPVAEVARGLSDQVTSQLKTYIAELKARQAAERAPLDQRRDELRSLHRAERDRLTAKQAERWKQETESRAGRLRTGLAGLWDTLSGKAKAIKEQNRLEAYEGLRRDQRQRDGLIADQLRERRALQSSIDALRARQSKDRRTLARDAIMALRERARLQNAAGKEAERPSDPAHSRRKRGFSLDR